MKDCTRQEYFAKISQYPEVKNAPIEGENWSGMQWAVDEKLIAQAIYTPRGPRYQVAE